MVLYVTRWKIHPEKQEAYYEKAQGWMKTVASTPGVVEVRGYRPVSGDAQVVVTNEFADMAAWAAWSSNEAVQQAWQELHAHTLHLSAEVWGPSPVIPQPIRPGG